MLLFNWGAFGLKALSVPTGSMRPGMPPGSLVLMHRVPLSSLKAGDIITYTNPLTMKSTITHRIIKIYKIDGKVPTFITKGDANLSPDPPVVGGLVKGQAVWYVPYVGEWLMWSKTWLGISLLVYVPALLIMVEETQRLADYYKSLQPYRLPGFEPVKNASMVSKRLAVGTASAISFIVLGLFIWQPALALLKSNTVTLGPNKITLAPIKSKTTCSSNTSINVSNSSSQTASSGNASSSGGSATSGNASNSNSSNTSISVTNC
jgi:signal peptidase